jgi:hypothetical protein
VLREQHIDSVSLVYAGSPQIDLTQFGLPPFRLLKPYEHADGWVAISLLRLKAGGLGFPVDAFSWLDAYTPRYRAGHSIWIFHVPAAGAESREAGVQGVAASRPPGQSVGGDPVSPPR